MDTTESTDSSSSEATSSSESFDSGSSAEQGDSGASRDESNNRGPVPGSYEDNVPRGTNGNSQGEQKVESRYERTKREKQEFKAQKADFEKLQQAFANERAQFAELRRQHEEAKKPKRDYSLDQLKKYRNEWADEGDKDDLVARADEEIRAMEAEEKASKLTMELPRPGTDEHTRQWREMEAQLQRDDPDFLKAGTPLDTEIHKLFAGPNAKAYRDHPQGIYAAYSEAKRVVLTNENKSLRSENQQLKEELKRFTGLTSIGGGSPGRIGDGQGRDFSRLSSADMRKRLMADKRDGVGPWL